MRVMMLLLYTLYSRLDERRKELVAASAFHFGCTHDLFLTCFPAQSKLSDDYAFLIQVHFVWRGLVD